MTQRTTAVIARHVARFLSRRTRWGSLVFPLVMLSASVSGGCFFGGGPDPRPSPEARASSVLDAPVMTVAVDGDVSDWPTTAAAVADQHYLYLRFKADRLVTLQSDTETVQLQLDVDADTGTGQPDPAGGLGVDLAVTFSPPNDEGEPGFGTRVEAFAESGEVVELPAAALDILMAPTHASEWFEVRVGRHLIRSLAGEASLPRDGLLSDGSVMGRVAVFGSGGRLLASAEPFEVDLAPASVGPKRVSASVPGKSLGSMRLLAYNVENSSPVENPGPFSRILRATDPDIVCVQEWYDQTPESLEAWFNRELPIAGRWRAFTSEGRGVAVVTRFESAGFGPDAVTVTPEGQDRTVRAASAFVDTPAGPVVISSVHLKCCGSVGGREDMLRSAEARGIAEMIGAEFDESGAMAAVIAGDYNLVGGTGPLAEIGQGIDADGSDLAVVEARGLGEPTMYTWTKTRSSFLPGRLDYVSYSDSLLTVERSFVFDPGRFDSPSLVALNLREDDAEASDHRPVVVDFRPR
ncbi:MAG: endonuclease/exonuclease/phosphatase family protein [Planctomycetota bacterium]